jgi:hypothetical protein
VFADEDLLFAAGIGMDCHHFANTAAGNENVLPAQPGTPFCAQDANTNGNDTHEQWGSRLRGTDGYSAGPVALRWEPVSAQ